MKSNNRCAILHPCGCEHGVYLPQIGDSKTTSDINFSRTYYSNRKYTDIGESFMGTYIYISLKNRDIEKAKKIAEDMFAEYKAKQMLEDEE